MSAAEANLMLLGALSACAWIASVFFLRFWRVSRDRLFLFFCVAFVLLGMNWLSLAVIHWGPETRHRGFFVRLVAFLLIIVAVIDKNRRGDAEKS